MRIVVTGGVGFIGSHVCEQLAARGDKVYCLDNFNDYYVKATGNPHFLRRKDQTLSELLALPNFRLLCDDKTGSKIDILNRPVLERVLHEIKPIDAVIHLAALAGVRYSEGREQIYNLVNVEGTQTVIETAREFGVRKFVVASSSSVYAGCRTIPFSENNELVPAPNAYGRSKQEMERTCRTLASKDYEIALLRFFSVYGPRGRPDMAVHMLADSAFSGTPFKKKGPGTDKRDWTYVADIARGVVATIDAPLPEPVEAINLGNSIPVSLNTLIALTEKYAGRGPNIREGAQDPKEMRETCADITKANRILDWMPTTTIEDGLRRFYDWYRR